ncbi:hypothetical protein P8452_56484 [Trifolium repens]|nr:hypothetical protein P8452_56484 [Trifolium repens]
MHERTFGQFARVLVDMDLSQPLRFKVLVERKGFAFFVELEYENVPDFSNACQVIGHHVDNCRRWNREEMKNPDKEIALKKKSTVEPKKIYVPANRTQQSKEFEVNVEVNNEAAASPEKEIINVDDSGGKSQQATNKGKEVANQVEVLPVPQQRLVVEKLAVQVTNAETVLSPVVSPRAILKNQDQQLEDDLNRDRLEDECSDDSNDSFVSSTQIHHVSTSAAIVTPEQRQTPVNVVKDMEFLKDSWANMAEEEDEVLADNNLVSPAHDDGFTVSISKHQKKIQKKKSQSSKDSYATGSKVLQKPFK